MNALNPTSLAPITYADPERRWFERRASMIQVQDLTPRDKMRFDYELSAFAHEQGVTRVTWRQDYRTLEWVFTFERTPGKPVIPLGSIGFFQ